MSEQVEFGILLAGPVKTETVGTWAKDAEDLGFRLFAVGDSPGLWEDAYCLLAVAAAATSRIQLAPVVTNPVTRHVGVSASAIATIDNLSHGRAMLGVGIGDSGVLNLGLRPARLRDLESMVTAVQALTGGQQAEQNGHRVINRWAKRSVPVLVAAAGQQTLQMAGRVADGVILSSGLDARATSTAAEQLTVGFKNRSSAPASGQFETWHQVRFSVADSREHAIRRIRPIVAAVGHHALSLNPEQKNVPDQYIGAFHELHRRYDSSQHVAPGDSPNALLVDELGLTEYLVDRFAIAGTPEECAAQVTALAQRGVTRLFLATSIEPHEQLLRWGSEVMPRLGQPARAGSAGEA